MQCLLDTVDTIFPRVHVVNHFIWWSAKHFPLQSPTPSRNSSILWILMLIAPVLRSLYLVPYSNTLLTSKMSLTPVWTGSNFELFLFLIGFIQLLSVYLFFIYFLQILQRVFWLFLYRYRWHLLWCDIS